MYLKFILKNNYSLIDYRLYFMNKLLQIIQLLVCVGFAYIMSSQ